MNCNCQSCCFRKFSKTFWPNVIQNSVMVLYLQHLKGITGACSTPASTRWRWWQRDTFQSRAPAGWNTSTIPPSATSNYPKGPSRSCVRSSPREERSSKTSSSDCTGCVCANLVPTTDGGPHSSVWLGKHFALWPDLQSSYRTFLWLMNSIRDQFHSPCHFGLQCLSTEDDQSHVLPHFFSLELMFFLNNKMKV